MAVLRSDVPDPDRTVATAEGIPHLIQVFRASGMHVIANLDAMEGVKLDPSVDAALYRVAQEALTNAQRHGTGQATVDATTTDQIVMIDIVNPTDPKRVRPAPGFGLIGMRERVELAGGKLDIRDDEHRFVVRAQMPRTLSSTAAVSE